ncbi:MAG: ABC transporter ATP-binding protein [Thermoanaerobacteraceae bacterium]|nr:ABC transporter ATP-binding protein [Thermoanaerobacteraceae bacterium]
MGISLRAEGIKVVKGRLQVLAVDEFDIAPGEIWGIIGPNGAGKSTLLHVLSLLERPDEGTVYFDGRPVNWRRQEIMKLRRQLAVVFQEPLLLNTTVYQNVALGLRFRGVKGPEMGRRVQKWLEILGIAHLALRKPWELSGGEARRVSLARALVLEPQVLLLDEPFVALDAPTRAALLVELRRLLQARGITALFVTHDFTELPLLADRVAVLLEGRIVQTGRPRDIPWPSWGPHPGETWEESPYLVALAGSLDKK